MNKLYIASAGAGKTTYLVEEALKCDGTVLITTYTTENEQEIKDKFIKINDGFIPQNITIQTWFSFLIEHGAKPYQGKLTNKNINGLLLVNQMSAVKYRIKGRPITYSKEDVDNYYFSKDYKIYSDKLSNFVVECNILSNGFVIDRISSIYNNIFIDEVQDLAGYDLEIIKQLLKTNSYFKMAGDPRQVTYNTHNSQKYKKYSNGKIEEFLVDECKGLKYEIDLDTLKNSWRNNQPICEIANKLFPKLPQCDALNDEITSHDGIFLVKEKNISSYLEVFSPMQLRYSRSTEINNDLPVLNFGESKGKTFNRVLIYPTKNMIKWFLNNTKIESFIVKCKLYVAITRARYSVGIVCKDNVETDVFPFWESDSK